MSIYDSFPTNMSLIRPQDAMNLVGAALPSNQGWGNLGMNTQAMDAAKMLPNQTPQMTAPEQGANQMDMYKMAAGALQGLVKPQQQVQNPLQIINDKNQFRYAGFQQNPQQQMAQALRQRG